MEATVTATDSVETLTRQAYEATLALNLVPDRLRRQALKTVAMALEDAQDKILEANTLDLEACQDMAIPDLLQEWLKLTPERLQQAIHALDDLSNLLNPILPASATANGAIDGRVGAASYVQRIPIGVVALIYEAFPELGAIMAGLCIRTGNSLILRGGSETSHSNQAIVRVIQKALEMTDLPTSSVTFISPDQGASLKDLVTLDRWIHLIIPYGRPSLTRQVLRQATAPVLRTGIGNCYLYWAASASLETVRWMISDSHASEPDPVNAIEKVLVDSNLKDYALKTLWSNLREEGFELRGDANLVEQFSELSLAADDDWSQPYLDRIVAFREIDQPQSAVVWMNSCSSGHADSVATESYSESRFFAQTLKSATVHINCSPRFYRNPNHGYDLAVGMSNQPGNHWGRIGIEALTTLKQVNLGNEHI